MDIKDNTAMPIYQRISESSVIDEKQNAPSRRSILKPVSKTLYSELTRNLSGETNKVIIAVAGSRWNCLSLMNRHSIDVGAKNEIYPNQ